MSPQPKPDFSLDCDHRKHDSPHLARIWEKRNPQRFGRLALCPTCGQTIIAVPDFTWSLARRCWHGPPPTACHWDELMVEPRPAPVGYRGEVLTYHNVRWHFGWVSAYGACTHARHEPLCPGPSPDAPGTQTTLIF